MKYTEKAEELSRLPEIRNAIMACGTRLLERQLYLAQFDGADSEMVLKALHSYQNSDGGFGNGIEPDLNTPESTAIAMETALCYFDSLGMLPAETAIAIVNWVDNSINKQGFIEHPTPLLEVYPHMPWWKNRDDYRILSVTGLLLKLNVTIPESLLEKVEAYAAQFPLPEVPEEYDYPLFLYALYNKKSAIREEVLSSFKERFEALNSKKQDHFLLFNRYWKHFSFFLDRSYVEKEAERVLSVIEKNGYLPTPYPDLPWWTPIATLDALIAVKNL